MAKYFKNPAGLDGMLPTIEETAAYYREQNVAVIFPVDRSETGFRRTRTSRPRRAPKC